MNHDGMLRDLIYLDFEKATSAFSQLDRGLLREMQSTAEDSRDRRVMHKGDLKVYKPEYGETTVEKSTEVESRILHHDVLVRLEEILFDRGLAVDLNAALAEVEPTPARIRAAVADGPYVRAEGWAVIEDYERAKRIAANFNPLVGFIQRSIEENLKKTDEYRSLEAQLAEQREAVKRIQNRDERVRAQARLKALESHVQSLLKAAGAVDAIPDWLIEGLRILVDAFMPGRINLRVFPFEAVPSFQVLANLKRDCFLEQDLDNLVYAYGTQPDIKLTVLGLVTSLPRPDGPSFKALQEFARAADGETSDERTFEKGFSGLFSGFEALERFVRYAHYPSVAAYPLAVYRVIRAREMPAEDSDQRGKVLTAPGA